MDDTVTRVTVYLIAALVGIKLVEFGWKVPLFGMFLVLVVASVASVRIGAWVGVSPEAIMLCAVGVVVALVCGLAIYGWWKGIK